MDSLLEKQQLDAEQEEEEDREFLLRSPARRSVSAQDVTGLKSHGFDATFSLEGAVPKGGRGSSSSSGAGAGAGSSLSSATAAANAAVASAPAAAAASSKEDGGDGDGDDEDGGPEPSSSSAAASQERVLLGEAQTAEMLDQIKNRLRSKSSANIAALAGGATDSVSSASAAGNKITTKPKTTFLAGGGPARLDPKAGSSASASASAAFSSVLGANESPTYTSARFKPTDKMKGFNLEDNWNNYPAPPAPAAGSSSASASSAGASTRAEDTAAVLQDLFEAIPNPYVLGEDDSRYFQRMVITDQREPRHDAHHEHHSPFMRDEEEACVALCECIEMRNKFQSCLVPPSREHVAGGRRCDRGTEELRLRVAQWRGRTEAYAEDCAAKAEVAAAADKAAGGSRVSNAAGIYANLTLAQKRELYLKGRRRPEPKYEPFNDTMLRTKGRVNIECVFVDGVATLRVEGGGAGCNEHKGGGEGGSDSTSNGATSSAGLSIDEIADALDGYDREGNTRRVFSRLRASLRAARISADSSGPGASASASRSRSPGGMSPRKGSLEEEVEEEEKEEEKAAGAKSGGGDGEVLRCPIDAVEYFRDYHRLLELAHSNPAKSLSYKRLRLLEQKFSVHQMLNREREMANVKGCPHRDFYNVRKVDTHIHHSACMNAKHLLRFIKHKLKTCPDEVVIFRNGEYLTLSDVFKSLNLTAYDLSIDTLDMHADSNTFHRFDRFNLKYNPCGNSRLREVFLKTDNLIAGRFLAELTKEVYSDVDAAKYQLMEPRISIYGRKRNEWSKLGSWVHKNRLASRNVRYMVQVPRLYFIYKKLGMVDSFQDMLDNIFIPLFEVTADPQSDISLSLFLEQCVGFDCVDDESRPELNSTRRIERIPPSQWTYVHNPPYHYWMYYLWANIQVLNHFRAARGLTTLSLRPHCGEAGEVNHLASGFLVADGINHGIMLRKQPSLQYLYYLTQIGLAVSPLSNNKLFLQYANNPFPLFFKRGLNVSLSTDDPLMLHMTKDALLEEYSVAMQVYSLSSVDLCEIARNSVLQSGFERRFKAHFLGKDFDVWDRLPRTARALRRDQMHGNVREIILSAKKGESSAGAEGASEASAIGSGAASAAPAASESSEGRRASAKELSSASAAFKAAAAFSSSAADAAARKEGQHKSATPSHKRNSASAGSDSVRAQIGRATREAEDSWGFYSAPKNDITMTNVPDIRVLYRHETLSDERDYIFEIAQNAAR